MSISFIQARDIAQARLRTMSGQTELQFVGVREFAVGWVFSYQAARYVATGDVDEMVVGNAPMFIARSDGQLEFPSTHRPLEKSVDAYRTCGDVHAQQVPTIRLLAGRPGASTSAAIQAIRQYVTVGVVEAKASIDACLSREHPTVQLQSMEDAKALVLALGSAGFEAEICYSVPTKRVCRNS